MRTMWSAADFVYPDSPSGPPLLRCKKARTAPGFPPNPHFDRCVLQRSLRVALLTATVKFLHVEPASTAEVAHQKFTSVYFRPRSPSDHDRSHVRHNEISP
jgi:hypothetical protein